MRHPPLTCQAYLEGDVVLVHHVLADMTQEGVSLVRCSPHRGQSASTRQSRWETGRLRVRTYTSGGKELISASKPEASSSYAERPYVRGDLRAINRHGLYIMLHHHVALSVQLEP